MRESCGPETDSRRQRHWEKDSPPSSSRYPCCEGRPLVLLIPRLKHVAPDVTALPIRLRLDRRRRGRHVVII